MANQIEDMVIKQYEDRASYALQHFDELLPKTICEDHIDVEFRARLIAGDIEAHNAYRYQLAMRDFSTALYMREGNALAKRGVDIAKTKHPAHSHVGDY